MRNNKSLAAAITTALSFVPGIVAGQLFENVDTSTPATVADEDGQVYNQGGTTTPYGVPIPRFDFTSGETIVFVPNEKATSESDPGGLLFASELFGSGNVILPTPRTGKTSGQYMAVVYTIDGDVVSNFEMTFTLDGGAVFAAEPVLGVLDGAGSGSVTVSGVTARLDVSSTASMTAADSSLTADTVFQFDVAGSPLYQVSAATATTPSAISFYELGNSSNQTAFSAAVSSSTVVYASGGAAGVVTSVVIPAGAITGTLATAGATTLQVKDASLFTAGWSYICNSPYDAAAKAAEPVFRVTNKVTTTTPHKLLVSVLPTGTAGTGTFGTAATCSQSSAIYRVHVAGDSVISVSSTTGFVKGHIYQFDNKGAAAATNGATTVISHQTTPYMVTDIGTNVITIQNMTNATQGLGITIQDAEKLYDTAIDKDDSWTVTNVSAGVPKKAKSSAIGKNSATFVLNAGQTTPVNLALANNDQIMLLYKLGTVNKLADPGQAINMTVDLKAAYSGMIVNPHRSIVVARSAKALNAKLKSIEGGTLHIAVSTGSTQFVGETSNSLVGFFDNYVAQIGQVVIGTDDSSNVPKMEDGVTDFALGTDAVLAEKSTLTITGGQFEASRTLPGQVYLQVGPSITRVADSTTQDADGWTAIWNLNSAMLKEIYDNSAEDKPEGTIIRIRTDSTTAVNVPENKPHATLTINYDNAAYQDLTVESDLRKIAKDGTVCTVYNVPPPKKGVIGADTLSIRVTNDSAVSGKLLGKLYSQDGGDPIWSGDLTTEEVPAGATVRFTSEDVATISGTTWDGRAVLEISTILPKVEVMAMIRQNGIRMAPLSNLSAGAHGTSCE